MAYTTDRSPLADSLPTVLRVNSNERMVEIITRIVASLPVKCVAVWDALILDWQLPRMNGWQVLSTVRGKMQPAPPRVVILSACEGGCEHMLAENVAGADAFLEKPLETDSLSQEISRQLAMPRPGSTAHA